MQRKADEFLAWTADDRAQSADSSGSAKSGSCDNAPRIGLRAGAKGKRQAIERAFAAVLVHRRRCAATLRPPYNPSRGSLMPTSQLIGMRPAVEPTRCRQPESSHFTAMSETL